MRTLHTLMPMAGEGSRFLNVGCRIPKPLIRVEGLYLFQRALIGLADIPAPRKYTFIVRAEHIRNYGIDMRIRAFYPDANIVSVEKTTRGAAETCLLAADYIAPDDALVVQDCDLEFKSADFVAAILSDLVAEPHVAGYLFRSQLPTIQLCRNRWKWESTSNRRKGSNFKSCLGRCLLFCEER